MTDPIAIAGLAVGLAVGVVLTGITILFCCLWCNTRKQLKILKRRIEYEAVVGKRDDQKLNQELNQYPSEPLPGTYYPEHAPPSPIKPRHVDTSHNYHAVNNLAILPDELRTPENLEAGATPLDKERAEKLVNEYLKQKQNYEEAQLKLTSNQPVRDSSPQTQPQLMATTTKPVPTPPTIPRPEPGYEDIDPTGYEQVHPTAKKQPSPKSKHDLGDYDDPADSLPEHFMKDRQGKLSGQRQSSSSSPRKQKTFQLTTSNDEYTEVFDNLPPGEVGVVGLPKARSMSESHSSTKRTSPKHGVVQNGLKEAAGVSQPAGGSLENVQPFGERKDSTRQSKRDSTKEIVELDTGKKKFRMTSGKRDVKKIQDMVDGDEVEKKFEMSGEESGQSYAVVNLADKQKYRTESDGLKKEGSGPPTHYGGANGNELESSA